MSAPEIVSTAGDLSALADNFLTAVRVAGVVASPTFMAEARARIETKIDAGRDLTPWEENNHERALRTPLDETQPAVRLAAIVCATKLDFESSIVTVYADMVLPGKGLIEALTGDGTDAYRVGRFARAHNGAYAPWSFVDSRGADARDFLAYAREVL